MRTFCPAMGRYFMVARRQRLSAQLRHEEVCQRSRITFQSCLCSPTCAPAAQSAAHATRSAFTSTVAAPRSPAASTSIGSAIAGIDGWSRRGSAEDRAGLTPDYTPPGDFSSGCCPPSVIGVALRALDRRPLGRSLARIAAGPRAGVALRAFHGRPCGGTASGTPAGTVTAVALRAFDRGRVSGIPTSATAFTGKAQSGASHQYRNHENAEFVHDMKLARGAAPSAP